MRVAVRGGALGDVLLGIPAWRAVRDAAPGVPLVVAAPGAVAPLVRAALAPGDRSPDPVTVVGHDDPAIASMHADGPLRASVAIPDWRGVTLAIAWTRSHREVAARLEAAGVARVVAADPFPPRGSASHAAEWLLATLADAGIAFPAGWDAAPWLRVPPGTEMRGPVATDGRPVAIVHPGSGSARKCWPADRWRALLGHLSRDGWRLTVLEGEADAEAVGAVLGGEPSRGVRGGRVEVVRGEGLASVAGRLVGASVVVANDSGIAHLAAGLGAPVVAVFGATDPATWRPRGPRVVTVGGTPGSAWPHAGGAPPGDVAWPGVDEVVAAIRTVAGAPPSRVEPGR